MNVLGTLKSLRSRMPVFGRAKKSGASLRRFARHRCLHVAKMRILERHFDVDGIVTEVSLKGVRFRPASMFILNRVDQIVSVTIDNMVLRGLIRNATPMGYGIMLTSELTDEQLNLLVETGAEPDLLSLAQPAPATVN